MQKVRAFLRGMVSVLTIMPAPLYRYPHRNSAESFRGDWSRIGKDISFIMDEIKYEHEDIADGKQ